jgi:hypothetical protein
MLLNANRNFLHTKQVNNNKHKRNKQKMWCHRQLPCARPFPRLWWSTTGTMRDLLSWQPRCPRGAEH